MARTANRKERRADGKVSGRAGIDAARLAGRLQAALQRHMAGDVTGAVGIYDEILGVDPHQPDALHLLGVACLQSGRLADAVDLIGKAIAEGPGNPDYYGNLAAALLRLDRDREAADAAQAAIDGNPQNAGFHANLAVALKRLGQPLDAALAFGKALELNPTTIRLHKEIAELLLEAKSYEQAVPHYRAYAQQIADDPEMHVCWNNLGCALEKCGQLQEAETWYKQALAAQPNDPDYVNNVGLISRWLGDFDAAESHLRRALELSPGDRQINTNIIGLLSELGRFDEAEEIAKRQIDLHPDEAQLWVALGTLHKAAGRPAEAREACLGAIGLDPKNVIALQELGTSYIMLGDPQAAYDTFKKVLEVDPQNLGAHLLMCDVLQTLKRPDEANIRAHAIGLLPNYRPQNIGYPLKAFRYTCDFDGIEELGDVWGMLETIPASMLTMSFLNLLAMADTPESTRKLVKLHRRWGEWTSKRANRNPIPPLPERQRPGKIRIGLLSSDLYSHSVAVCMGPLIESYDRDRFEMFCYSPKEVPGDAVQAKIKAQVDRFRFLVGRPDVEFAEAIRADGVDILIDLNGFTQNSRTSVLAHKPAPVQVSYLGYPFTYGIPEIDYMLLDRYLQPEADDLLMEKPLAKDGSWICFTDMGPHDVDPNLPSETNGYVTFGTLNNPYKFTREAVATWAAVMRELPNSRFLMVRRTDGSTMRCHHLTQEFARHGIDADRVLFMRNEAGQHLPSYHQFDMSLDTFPLTGGTTTCDSLWMGVPVVSLRGPSFHQRLSHAILNHAGLGDLSCGTKEEFVEKAVALANDADRRRQIRAGLRGQLLDSDMFRADKFVPTFQDTMMGLVEKHGLR